MEDTGHKILRKTFIDVNRSFEAMNKYQKIVITVFFGLMVCAILFPPYIRNLPFQGIMKRSFGFLFYPPRFMSIDITTLSVEILLILIIGAFVYFLPKFGSSKNKSDTSNDNEVIVLKRNNEKE